MKMTSHYYGDRSGRFWKLVNSLPDEEHTLYTMGCALQDLEGRVLQILEARLENKERRKTGRAKRPVQQAKPKKRSRRYV